MNKIQNAFANGKAFFAFLVCGDPDLTTTAAAIRAAAENGADLILLGIPFSDPTAVDPTIQAASLRARKSGITTDQILDFVRVLRRDVGIPIVFSTYANVVFSYGAERFLSACGALGIDGLSLLDLPFEEKAEFLPLCRQFGIDLISQIAPTSQNRIAMIAEEAAGFLSVASAPGAEDVAGGLAAVVQAARQHCHVPCVIDSDISTPAQAAELAAISDGITSGSAIIRLLEAYGSSAPEHIGAYVNAIKAALR